MMYIYKYMYVPIDVCLVRTGARFDFGDRLAGADLAVFEFEPGFGASMSRRVSSAATKGPGNAMSNRPPSAVSRVRPCSPPCPVAVTVAESLTRARCR